MWVDSVRARWERVGEHSRVGQGYSRTSNNEMGVYLCRTGLKREALVCVGQGKREMAVCVGWLKREALVCVGQWESETALVLGQARRPCSFCICMFAYNLHKRKL